MHPAAFPPMLAYAGRQRPLPYRLRAYRSRNFLRQQHRSCARLRAVRSHRRSLLTRRLRPSGCGPPHVARRMARVAVPVLGLDVPAAVCAAILALIVLLAFACRSAWLPPVVVQLPSDADSDAEVLLDVRVNPAMVSGTRDAQRGASARTSAAIARRRSLQRRLRRDGAAAAAALFFMIGCLSFPIALFTAFMLLIASFGAAIAVPVHAVGTGMPRRAADDAPLPAAREAARRASRGHSVVVARGRASAARRHGNALGVLMGARRAHRAGSAVVDPAGGRRRSRGRATSPAIPATPATQGTRATVATSGRVGRPSLRDAEYLDAHTCGELTECSHCHALLFAREAGVTSTPCCGSGARVLGDVHNPPLPADYEALLRRPRMSFYSRAIGHQTAFGALGTSPSLSEGGLGLRPGERSGARRALGPSCLRQ